MWQVYKRVAGEGYKLKMTASRTVFGEIIKKYPSLPFTLRSLEAKNARLGLPECVNHDLLQPYPVLHEKPSALVAQFKATVLLLPNGSDRITTASLQEIKSEKKVCLCTRTTTQRNCRLTGKLTGLQTVANASANSKVRFLSFQYVMNETLK